MLNSCPHDGKTRSRPDFPRAVLGVCLAALSFSFVAVGGKTSVLARWISDLYRLRSEALATRDFSAITPHYASNGRAREALAHEIRRCAVLRAWLERHRARLIRVQPRLRLLHIEPADGEATVHVTLTTTLIYVYKDAAPPLPNVFGFTTYHLLRVTGEGGRWLVKDEWYEDPLCQNVPFGETGGWEPLGKVAGAGTEPSRAGRAAALYADRYCGVPVPAGSDGRYNRAYPDLTFNGGDCANFVSQALADPAAGGMPKEWAWYADRKGATVAWSRADCLVDYLLYSGRADLAFRGRLGREMLAGALQTISPGDIIGYQEKGAGTVSHVAIVSAIDSEGWPLVDSHTADRYHNPFDLGWGEETVYWLLRTRWPADRSAAVRERSLSGRPVRSASR